MKDYHPDIAAMEMGLDDILLECPKIQDKTV